jgi:hypothetical protein
MPTLATQASCKDKDKKLIQIAPAESTPDETVNRIPGRSTPWQV